MSEKEKQNTAVGTASEGAMNDNAEVKSTVDGEKKKQPKNKIRGIRKSKIDPELMSQIQHIENKMRIVRIFVMLLIGAIFLGVIFFFVDHMKKRTVRNAHMEDLRAQIKTCEQAFSENNDKLYDSAVSAVKAIRLAEELTAYAPLS